MTPSLDKLMTMNVNPLSHVSVMKIRQVNHLYSICVVVNCVWNIVARTLLRLCLALN